ncbi:CvpA family protein [Chondrinema litorale]|uniref:CvpA family protein n=1 Tax=Chondrinema litorale TaxID=2994555 RepID=UPI002543B60B|nr:CvpA family protein [Chondrinema litorale]UZR94685.1 CvpA family protein [Chondrinema litorale]
MEFLLVINPVDILAQISGKGVESYFSSYVRVVDIILAFFILWGAYKGYQKGFIVEFVSILVFIFGILIIFFAITYLFVSADNAVGKSPKLAKFLFFIFFYVIGSLSLNKLGRFLQGRLDYSVFDSLDNFASMILGAAKYAVFLSIFIGLLDAAGLRLSKEVVADAKLYPMLLNLQVWLVDVGKTLAPSIGEMHQHILDMLSE